MAGDWIKIRGSLISSPKIIRIARYLQEQRDFRDWITPGGGGPMNGQIVSDSALRFVALSGATLVWAAAREYGFFDGDGLVLPGMTVEDLDGMAGCPCFGLAMEKVGWALNRGESVILPNFKQHNALTPSERMKKVRQKRNYGCENVAQDAQHSRNGVAPDAQHERNNVAHRGEERRGEEEILRISSDPTSTPLRGPLEGAVDFDSVFDSHHLCASLRRKLPPASEQDRRFFAKLAVLVDRGLLLPAWVNEACASTIEKRRKKPIAFFTGCLRNRCREEHGADLKSLLSQVEFSNNGKTP